MEASDILSICKYPGSLTPIFEGRTILDAEACVYNHCTHLLKLYTSNTTIFAPFFLKHASVYYELDNEFINKFDSITLTVNHTLKLSKNGVTVKMNRTFAPEVRYTLKCQHIFTHNTFDLNMILALTYALPQLVSYHQFCGNHINIDNIKIELIYAGQLYDLIQNKEYKQFIYNVKNL